MLGFALNLAVAWSIVRHIYYPVKQNKNYVFTFLAFNTIIYFVLSLLSRVELSVGVGFGLFAIFSVLRYRTDPIPIREMTYLFIVIALPVMNAILMNGGEWVELLSANAAVVVVLYALEKEWGFHYASCKRVTYEKIELVKPENRRLLLQDLHERTGLDIKRCEIGRVDFLHDTAEIKVYYDEPEHL
jgi:hypothetical protein